MPSRRRHQSSPGASAKEASRSCAQGGDPFIFARRRGDRYAGCRGIPFRWCGITRRRLRRLRRHTADASDYAQSVVFVTAISGRDGQSQLESAVAAGPDHRFYMVCTHRYDLPRADPARHAIVHAGGAGAARHTRNQRVLTAIWKPCRRSSTRRMSRRDPDHRRRCRGLHGRLKWFEPTRELRIPENYFSPQRRKGLLFSILEFFFAFFASCGKESY